VGLDLRTIYAIASLTSLIIGAFQILAWATGRFERWPLWWGSSNVLIGLGTLIVTIQGNIPALLLVQFASLVTLAGYALLVIGVRSFAGKAAAWRGWAVALACATAPMLILWRGPGDYQARIALLALLVALCDMAIVRDCLQLARRERLATAWILVALFAPTALLFVLRAGYGFADRLGGPDIFHAGNLPHVILAFVASSLITLRGMALLMLAVERSRNQLLAMALHDPLTGAMNRNGLSRALAGLAATRRPCGPVSILLIDIDRFKALNDTHGHAVGDTVLCLLAASAARERRADDIVARMGGDEFVIVMPRTPLPEAIAIAHRLRAGFGEAIAMLEGLRPWLTVSVGAAEGNLEGEGFELVLQRADEALYCSKREGRDRVHSRLLDMAGPVENIATLAAA